MITEQKLTPRQKEVYDAIRSGGVVKQLWYRPSKFQVVKDGDTLIDETNRMLLENLVKLDLITETYRLI
jgi:hypothetical protein